MWLEGRHGRSEHDGVADFFIDLVELPVPAVSVSPVSSVAEALDRWRAGEGAQVLRSEFLDVLAAVPDPRDPRGVRHTLTSLLLAAVAAVLAGARSFTEIG